MASEIKVNNIKRATGTTITLGESGDTVALACGASQTGFGSDCMAWCAAIKSTGFTAVAGKGYFVNTCGGGVTVTLLHQLLSQRHFPRVQLKETRLPLWILQEHLILIN